MKKRQSAEGIERHDDVGAVALQEEEEGPRLKISITVPPEVLERIDAYRKKRGGLNRSALFSLAADWFMNEHPIKRHDD
ncbi:ribbon-helix-helix protein, CopG family [Paraburkholderia sp. Tr-20389]|uniref:ribbon-helix-helix protein, CopG family n=1 Tax=Paraburkholderia sp. Tr-20389 TaxID=2703903 RepID=UPI00198047AD|nr:ribbon-helix-helix protein, CopG family [Paraburkholderia sp. Tr-20389]MBN3756100.1 ribbon-helix-helix protein, CopG family [Paraburkholderia sp. Tr-20389]